MFVVISVYFKQIAYEYVGAKGFGFCPLSPSLFIDNCWNFRGKRNQREMCEGANVENQSFNGFVFIRMEQRSRESLSIMIYDIYRIVHEFLITLLCFFISEVGFHDWVLGNWNNCIKPQQLCLYLQALVLIWLQSMVFV